MYDLTTLGFSPFFEEQISIKNATIARIASEHRGGYRVWSNTGEGYAQLSGRLIRDLEGEACPGVGDWVILSSEPSSDTITFIEQVLNRRTVFIRGAAGRQSRGQVVAANIDIVFITCGLDNDYNLRRIERYLARVWASGAQPVIVLNKSDVCNDIDQRLFEVNAVGIGVDVIVTSAIQQEGMTPFQSFVPQGTTAAFVGSSGAGKSTIINALLGVEKMATGTIRARDGRGCHTTTHRQLIVLPRGGVLIDTPGMRELQLFDEDGIGAVFSDIEAFSAQCRFRDCSHMSEPGCAVKAAVETGEISTERLDHYRKLQKEAAAFELRRNEHKRRKSERVWGQLHDEAERIRRWKRSE